MTMTPTTPTDSGDAPYLFSGTVGDAYVALCKLHRRARQRPCSLRRMSRHGGDAMVAQLCDLFEGVTYVEPSLHFDRIEDMRTYAFDHARRYTNIYADGEGRGLEPDDPPEAALCDFPTLTLQPAARTRGRLRVGIQLHSGSIAATSKRLDPTWVAQLAHKLADAGLEVVLLGTGGGYEPEQLQRLPGEDEPGERAIDNLVGRTEFRDWLSHLAALDMLVSPEGCSVFFASSQRVPCLAFYDDVNALLRMAPAWRRQGIFVRFGDEQRTADRLLQPMSASQAASIVLARLDPRSA